MRQINALIPNGNLINITIGKKKLMSLRKGKKFKKKFTNPKKKRRWN